MRLLCLSVAVAIAAGKGGVRGETFTVIIHPIGLCSRGDGGIEGKASKSCKRSVVTQALERRSPNSHCGALSIDWIMTETLIMQLDGLVQTVSL